MTNSIQSLINSYKEIQFKLNEIKFKENNPSYINEIEKLVINSSIDTYIDSIINVDNEVKQYILKNNDSLKGYLGQIINYYKIYKSKIKSNKFDISLSLYQSIKHCNYVIEGLEHKLDTKNELDGKPSSNHKVTLAEYHPESIDFNELNLIINEENFMFKHILSNLDNPTHSSSSIMMKHEAEKEFDLSKEVFNLNRSKLEGTYSKSENSLSEFMKMTRESEI